MSPQSLLRKLRRRLARPQVSALVLAAPEDDAEAVVRSVLNQRLRELEVIVVTEAAGSAAVKCESLAVRDRRVRLNLLEAGQAPERSPLLKVPVETLRAAVGAARSSMLLVLDAVQDPLVADALTGVCGRLGTADAVVGTRRALGNAVWSSFLTARASFDSCSPATVLATRSLWCKTLNEFEGAVHLADLSLGLLIASKKVSHLERDVCQTRSQVPLDAAGETKELVRLLYYRATVARRLKGLERREVLSRTLSESVVRLAALSGVTPLAYGNEARRAAQSFVYDGFWEDLSQEPLLDRLLVHALVKGRQEDLEELVASRALEGNTPRLRLVKGVLKVEHPVLERLRKLPQDLLQVRQSDLLPFVATHYVRVGADGGVVICGRAYVKGVATKDVRVGFALVCDQEDTPLAFSRCPAPQADLLADDPWVSHADSGFKLTVPTGAGRRAAVRVRVEFQIGCLSLARWLPAPPQAEGVCPGATSESPWSWSSRAGDALELIEDAGAYSERKSAPQVYVNGARIVGNSLLLDLEVLACSPSVIEACSSGGDVPFKVRLCDGSYCLEVDLSPGLLSLGGHSLRWRANGMQGWCMAGPQLEQETLDLVVPLRGVRLRANDQGWAVLTLTYPITVFEQSRFGRQQLAGLRGRGVCDVVLFESFRGRSTADNPGAIFEDLCKRQLPVPMLWSVVDGPAPHGSELVVTGSRGWYEALKTARVIITNDHLPYWFTKQPEQFLLQTWHGSTVKRLLLDAPPSAVAPSYRHLMSKQVPQWDLLLAQTEEAARRLKSSMGYVGKVLVGEYPRNAKLLAGGQTGSRVRDKLGISQDAKVVLYAPTWREHMRSAAISVPGELMDPVALSAATGSVVLVRSHHMNRICSQGAGVLDVSTYPDVADLMLASDALVTDYSSIVFDWALTGRPCVLHVPDLEDYKAERGLYGNWPYDSGYVLSRNQEELELAVRAAVETPFPALPADPLPVERTLAEIYRVISRALS